jgi:hypothetical protein
MFPAINSEWKAFLLPRRTHANRATAVPITMTSTRPDQFTDAFKVITSANGRRYTQSSLFIFGGQRVFNLFVMSRR